MSYLEKGVCRYCGRETFGKRFVCVLCKKKKINTAICKTCGCTFIPRHSFQFYCSKICLEKRTSELEKTTRFFNMGRSKRQMVNEMIVDVPDLQPTDIIEVLQVNRRTALRYLRECRVHA